MAIQKYANYYEWISAESNSVEGGPFSSYAYRRVNKEDFRGELENLFSNQTVYFNKILFGFYYKSAVTSGDYRFEIDSNAIEERKNVKNTIDKYFETNYSSKCSSIGVPTSSISLGVKSTAIQVHFSKFKIRWYPKFPVYITSNDGAIYSSDYDMGTELSFSAASKLGYSFKKWSDNNTNEARVIVVDKQITLAAEYSPNIYSINLDNQSADIESGTSILYLKYNTGWYNTEETSSLVSSILIPKKTGYFFGGYYTATNGEGSQIIDNLGNINNGYLTFTTNDISLYAYWIPIVYDLVYDDGSGNQSSPISLAYDKKYKIEHFDAIFSEKNYPTWNLIYNDNGATEYFIDSEPIKRIWHNRWRKEGTTTDYGLNQEVSGLSSTDGDTVILQARWKAEAIKTNLSIPIRKYHQFAGWKDSSGNTYNQGDTFKFIENNSVLTAQWEKIQPRMFAGIDNIQKLFLSKDKEIKKIFVYITPENNGSGKHIEV